MRLIFGLLRHSFVAQTIAVALAAWAALGINNVYQRSRGASELAAKIEAKSDATAKTADEVRQEAATSKRGRPDPFRVRN